MNVENFPRYNVKEGERQRHYVREISNNKLRDQAIAAFVNDLLEGEESPGIVFVREKGHANNLAEAIKNEIGCEVPAVTSEMSKEARKKLIDKMQNGTLKVVVATAVWDQGIDIPNLSWVFMAGEGQAPIGYKQKAGRPTRLDEEKTSYTIYDLSTLNSGVSNYEEQSQKRQQHYETTGFSVGQLRPSNKPDEADANRLERLLTNPIMSNAEFLSLYYSVHPNERPNQNPYQSTAGNGGPSPTYPPMGSLESLMVFFGGFIFIVIVISMLATCFSSLTK